MEILLCAIQRDELLIILKFPGCSEVSELVNDRPVVPDELHDVARLQVTAVSYTHLTLPTKRIV